MTDNLKLPHSIDAEEAVISSILIDGELIKSINLEADDFYFTQNGLIFSAMLRLKEKGTNPNEITVAQELQEMGKLSDVGGAAQLSLLISTCPTSLDCLDYAKIVKKLATFRSLIAAADQIAAMGYDSDKSPEEALAKADSLILKLRKQAGTTRIITPDERAQMLYERYERLYTMEKYTAISTGLADLDDILGGGLYPRELIVLGARPSVGKTSMLQSISNYIGQTQNVLFCSGEMGMEDLSDRDVAGQIGVSVDTIRQGNYGQELYQDILDIALPNISRLKVIHRRASKDFGFNTTNIYQEAYGLQSRYGLSLIVVDYLSLLTDKYGNNNNERVGYISRTLKLMAQELNVPILAAHQLNRGTEIREDKRPQLHDLRDSGNVEQDSDVVLFLYRESYYKDTDNCVTEVKLAKKRQGKSGKTIKVLWNENKQMYCNLTHGDKEYEQEEML